MLYVKFKPEDCPNLKFYLHIWFFYEYVVQLFKLTRNNIRTMQFGQSISLIKIFIYTVFNLHKTIMSQYKISYKSAYDTYVEYATKK